MKVRVYTDYDPVSILRGIIREPDEEMATKCGLFGNFVEIDDSNIPKDRTDRDFWIHKNGKIEVDEVKRQEKLAKKAEKESKKNSVLQKLKITEEELASILKP